MAEVFQVKGTKEAINEWSKLNLEFVKSIDLLELQIDNANKLSKEYKKVTNLKGFTKFANDTTKLNKATSKTLSSVQIAYKEQIKLENKLVTQQEKLKLATEGTNIAVIKGGESLKKTNRELRAQAKITTTVEGSLERLKAVNIGLKIQRDKLVLTDKEDIETKKRLNTLIEKNTKIIRENTDADTERLYNIGQYPDVAKSIFPVLGRLDDLLSQSTNNTVQLGDLGSKGFAKLKSGILSATSAALKFALTPVGAVITALAGIGFITKEFLDYNVAIAESLKQTQDLTGLTSKGARTLRADVEALSESFDKDFKETLIGVNAVVKNFNIDYDEAVKLVGNGFARGADINGQFLDILKEYPAAFREIGFTAQEFVDLQIQAQKEGIYNDKLIDTIKEADLSLKEFTQTQKDALVNTLGEDFANKFENEIANGILTTKDAILLLGEESKKQNLNLQETQILTADVFKGAGEDAGNFANIIRVINLALDEENKALTELQQSTLDLSNANIDLKRAKDEALNSEDAILFLNNLKRLWLFIQTQFFTGISDLRGAVKELFNSFSQLLEPIREFAKPLTDLIGKSKTASKIFGLFKSSIKGLFTPFSTLTKLIKLVSAGLGGIVNVAKNVNDVFQSLKIPEFDISSPRAFFNSIKEGLSGLKNLDVSGSFAAGFSDSINRSNESSGDLSDDAGISESGENSNTGSVQERADKEVEIERVKQESIVAIRKGVLAINKEINNELLLDVDDVSNEILNKIQERADQEKAIEQEKFEEQKQIAKDYAIETAKVLGESFGLSGESIQGVFDIIEDGFKNTEDVIATAGAVISDVFNAIFEASNQRFEQQLENNEVERESALSNASLSNEQKEFLEEKYDRKKREIQKKQAQAEKKQAIFGIALSTAQGVAKAVAASPLTFGLPFSAFVAALGLAQIAAVASRKIPEYWSGTKNAPQGVAMTDERGAELHLDRYGKIKDLGSDKGARYKWLDKGDKIIPAQKTKELLKGLTTSEIIESSNNDLYKNIDYSNVVNYGGYGIDKEDLQQVMRETLSKQPRNIVVLDKNGINKYYKKGNSLTRLRTSI